MKTCKFDKIWFKFLLIICLMFFTSKGFADDTCIFTVTADSVPPNIVLLLDNGAEMEQIIWHKDYDNTVDYSTIDVHTDGIDNDNDGTVDELLPDLTEEIQWLDLTTSNGFTNGQGYSIVTQGGVKYIVKILADLTLDSYKNGIAAGSGSTFIINGRKITLPADPSTVLVDGVIDKATQFRYSMNYLNWIFFGPYAGTGADLPSQSRFYFAKKAIFTVAEITQRKAYFGINAFTATAAGSSNVQPLGFVYDLAGVVDPNFVNTINTLGTVDYSPLAEGLAKVGGYYASPSSGVVGEYCQKSFVIVITSGVSSEDQAVAAGSIPTALDDYDKDYDTVNSVDVAEGDVKVDAITYTVPMNINGSSYLDDVAWYLFTHDVVGYQDGWQNVFTYTIGFMGNKESNAYLTNTSNNGNGNLNLYDTTDKEYGKYHFEAEDPATLAQVLIDAINAILSQTSTFNAPVVPVTRTTSGNNIYLSFFKPSDGNFWQGDVAKYALDDDNNIIDKNGVQATWPNGAFKDTAEPFWSAKEWALNRHHSSRIIFTDSSFGDVYTWSDDPQTQGFHTTNLSLIDNYFGNTALTKAEIINYTRGADVFDEDVDGDVNENREIILGDVLHSEPLIVFFRTTDATGTETITQRVLFGSNDGMIHLVDDETGKEIWAYIPSHYLHRLKDVIEGTSHQYFIDGTPKAVCLRETALGSGIWVIDTDGFVDYNKNDRLIILCGERKGGSSYLRIEMLNPDDARIIPRFISDKNHERAGKLELDPISVVGTFIDGEPIQGVISTQTARVDGTLELNRYLDYTERINHSALFNVGETVTGLTSGASGTLIYDTTKASFNSFTRIVNPEQGESWADPKFTMIHSETWCGGGPCDQPAAIIGDGFSDNNSRGKGVSIYYIHHEFYDGFLMKHISVANTADMQYSIPSSVTIIDEDNDTITDKIYVGDLGGQVWRIGSFDVDSVTGDPLSFPDTDQNVDVWTAKRLLISDISIPPERKFYYPPTVTLEKGYDLVLTGSGDREDPCNRHLDIKGNPDGFFDAIYAVKDNHQDFDLQDFNLVDVTNETTAPTPDLNDKTADVDVNGFIDKGWFFYLEPGEKVLSKPVVFAGTFYATTFVPNDDPCLPGGAAMVYGVNYKTGAGAIDKDGITLRSVNIGGGIPSRPVVVIKEPGDPVLLISTGSTNPDDDSEDFDAGVIKIKLPPGVKFNLMWWIELFAN